MSKRIVIVLLLMLLVIGFPANQVIASNGNAVNMRVGDESFECTFYENDTAKALLESMPVKYKMSELNGNEKYKYLSEELPTNEKNVKHIKAGDIMLYGSDCLVVFYKSFNTSYEYTPVGYVRNPRGLENAVGKKKVTIRFSKKKEIGLSRKSLTLKPGKTKTIKLKGVKASKVKWSSSNRKIATVIKGKIKANRAGTATIIAKYGKKKYKCRVFVL